MQRTALADPAVFKVVQRLYEGDLVTRQMVGTVGMSPR